MATTMNESTTIKLIDGTDIEVRPLKISLLRSFMKEFEKIGEVATDNDKSMDILMKCVHIAMQQYKPDAADIDKLEENLDLPTVYKIVEGASGIKLGDGPLGSVA